MFIRFTLTVLLSAVSIMPAMAAVSDMMSSIKSVVCRTAANYTDIRTASLDRLKMLVQEPAAARVLADQLREIATYDKDLKDLSEEKLKMLTSDRAFVDRLFCYGIHSWPFIAILKKCPSAAQQFVQPALASIKGEYIRFSRVRISPLVLLAIVEKEPSAAKEFYNPAIEILREINTDNESSYLMGRGCTIGNGLNLTVKNMSLELIRVIAKDERGVQGLMQGQSVVLIPEMCEALMEFSADNDALQTSLASTITDRIINRFSSAKQHNVDVVTLRSILKHHKDSGDRLARYAIDNFAQAQESVIATCVQAFPSIAPKLFALSQDVTIRKKISPKLLEAIKNKISASALTLKQA